MSHIPDWADKYIRIPFKKKARGLDACDCLGLVQLIYEDELGIVLPDYVHTDPDEKELTGILITERKKEWIKLSKPEPFSLIILNIMNHPIHLGIVLNDESMIHTMKNKYSSIERYTGLSWKNRIEGFYKWPCM